MPDLKLTTADLQALLSLKYPRDRYVLVFDVPDNVGTNQHRRADAIAVGCWNSVGHQVEGFELKVSRGDWRRELQDVEKADPFIERCDRWWLVTATASMAKSEEIPACWGWLAATAGGLRVQRPAPVLPRDAHWLHRLFVIGVLRKMQQDITDTPAVERLLKAQVEGFNKLVDQEVERRMGHLKHHDTELTERVAKFEADSGLRLGDWRLGNVGKLAAALAKMCYGEVGLEAVDLELARQERTLTGLLEHVREAREALPLRGATPPIIEGGTPA